MAEGEADGTGTPQLEEVDDGLGGVAQAQCRDLEKLIIVSSNHSKIVIQFTIEAWLL